MKNVPTTVSRQSDRQTATKLRFFSFVLRSVSWFVLKILFLHPQTGQFQTPGTSSAISIRCAALYIIRRAVFYSFISMSLSKFESEVKTLNLSQTEAYARLSDLNNLAVIRERLSDPAFRDTVSGQVPADKLEELQHYVEQMTFETDALHIGTPMGQITLRIVEREEPKCIKFASEGAPIQLYLWIQLLPQGDVSSKLRVTVGAEVNFFMKGMVAKPLQQAADGLAQMLSSLR